MMGIWLFQFSALLDSTRWLFLHTGVCTHVHVAKETFRDAQLPSLDILMVLWMPFHPCPLPLSAIALCPPGQVRSGVSPQFHLHSLLGLRWSLFQWVKFICISFSRNYSCHVSISLVRFLAFSYWFVVALWYDGISIPFLGYSFIFFFFMMISCFLVLFWAGKNILIFMESIFLFFYNLEGLSHTEHGVPILRL